MGSVTRQNIAHKILLKSKRHTYIGYNDVCKSVWYYSAETRKILTLQNYVFLTARGAEPTEKITVKDTPTRKGERGERNAHAVENAEHPLNKPGNDCKWKREWSKRKEQPHKTRGVRPDYRRLADPFLEDKDSKDEKDDENLFIEVLMTEVGDKFYCLKEAKDSRIWPA
jgi:hypothetical protein